MNATAVQAMMPSTLVSESSSRWSGERTRVTEVSIVAIRPISVSMPVAVTTIAPVPRVTEVFWNSMSARSPSGTSGEASTAGSLATGALSPVSAASWASSVAERSRRPSAGTMSPASTSTMSPGTTSAAGTSATAPSRRTRLCGTCIFDSASTLARAFSSWREPSTRLRITSSATKIAVGTSPMTKLTAVTATSIRFIGSRSCASETGQTDGGFSPLISLGPYCGQPRRRLGLGQAVLGVAAEGGEDCRLVLRKPARGVRLGRGGGHVDDSRARATAGRITRPG